MLGADLMNIWTENEFTIKYHPVFSRLVTLIGAGFLHLRGVQLFLFRVHTTEWNIGDIEHVLCLLVAKIGCLGIVVLMREYDDT
jgi:hypothetical protein